MAAHAVGFRNRDFEGAAGFEAAFDRLLGFSHEQKAGTPCNARLSLRTDVQGIVEEEITKACLSYEARSACALILEAPTGRILAIQSWPPADPNRPSAFRPELWRNRSVAEVHEPGAAGRFLILAAKNSGMTASTLVDCENGLVAGRVFSDAEPSGRLSVEQLAAKPSNIGLARLGEAAGPERIYSTFTNLGIGCSTGIPLPSESRGILRPISKWQRATPSAIAIGYEYATTQLQLLLALNTIANEGWYVAPTLVDRIETQSGQLVWEPQPSRRRAVSPEIARETSRILVERVAAQGGNGASAAIPGIRVAACPGATLLFEHEGYIPGHYFCQCVGFLPADQPVISVAVAFEDPIPKDGEKFPQVAPLVFRRIAARTIEALRKASP